MFFVPYAVGNISKVIKIFYMSFSCQNIPRVDAISQGCYPIHLIKAVVRNRKIPELVITS